MEIPHAESSKFVDPYLDWTLRHDPGALSLTLSDRSLHWHIGRNFDSIIKQIPRNSVLNCGAGWTFRCEKEILGFKPSRVVSIDPTYNIPHEAQTSRQQLEWDWSQGMNMHGMYKPPLLIDKYKSVQRPEYFPPENHVILPMLAKPDIQPMSREAESYLQDLGPYHLIFDCLGPFHYLKSYNQHFAYLYLYKLTQLLDIGGVLVVQELHATPTDVRNTVNAFASTGTSRSRRAKVEIFAPNDQEAVEPNSIQKVHQLVRVE